jgi:hypothetical protein
MKITQQGWHSDVFTLTIPLIVITLSASQVHPTVASTSNNGGHEHHFSKKFQLIILASSISLLQTFQGHDMSIWSCWRVTVNIIKVQQYFVLALH